MSYNVKSISVFEKQSKRLLKKYPSLKNELLALVGELKENPSLGTSIGMNCYKIRISIASKGKGKRGGARVITNIVVKFDSVYLLSVYDKSEKANLTDQELLELLRYIPQ